MKNLLFLLLFVGLFSYLPTTLNAQIKIKCDVNDLKDLTVGEISGESKNGQTVVFDPKLMSLGVLSDKINCRNAIKEIEGRETLNVYILKYLKDNPDLIPLEWRKYKIIFPGVKFIGSDKNEFYLYLYYWQEGGWDICSAFLDEKLDANTKVAQK